MTNTFSLYSSGMVYALILSQEPFNKFSTQFQSNWLGFQAFHSNKIFNMFYFPCPQYARDKGNVTKSPMIYALSFLTYEYGLVFFLPFREKKS